MGIDLDASEIYSLMVRNKTINATLDGDVLTITATNSTETTPGIFIKEIEVTPYVPYRISVTGWQTTQRSLAFVDVGTRVGEEALGRSNTLENTLSTVECIYTLNSSSYNEIIVGVLIAGAVEGDQMFIKNITVEPISSVQDDYSNYFFRIDKSNIYVYLGNGITSSVVPTDPPFPLCGDWRDTVDQLVSMNNDELINFYPSTGTDAITFDQLSPTPTAITRFKSLINGTMTNIYEFGTGFPQNNYSSPVTINTNASLGGFEFYSYRWSFPTCKVKLTQIYSGTVAIYIEQPDGSMPLVYSSSSRGDLRQVGETSTELTVYNGRRLIFGWIAQSVDANTQGAYFKLGNGFLYSSSEAVIHYDGTTIIPEP